MTPADLELWREHMGWTANTACLHLGIAGNRWRRMRDGEVPIAPLVGLACAALAAGLPEWPGPPTPKTTIQATPEMITAVLTHLLAERS